jgi:3-hydroxyisobutyrate dehydrogenase-like beta-hydroxyacid dehydrogenase
MTDKVRVGFIGIGLMGHGAAKNILESGHFPLTILGNRNRGPVDDLVERGAREAASPADLAASCDVVFLCLPSSAEVETVVNGQNGVIGGLRQGAVLVDTTTADPSATRRIGAELASRGVDMLDAALGRTPREAEAGKLSTYVGGEVEVLDRVRPIFRTYADTIVHCGPLGAGTTCKLVNNSITIGMAALFAEGFVTAAKVGADLDALADVLSAGGADGRMWRMMEPWIRTGDDSHLRGPIRIAAKDVLAYNRMAESVGSAVPILQAVNWTFRLALESGHANVFLPALPGILADLNRVKLKPGRVD